LHGIFDIDICTI